LDPIEIDGSFGEGGGQVIRTSIALSALYGKPVRVSNIRAKRPNPGLQAQHLTGLKAVASLCDAELEGMMIGSTTVTFGPRGRLGGEFKFDIGTAGSITLVLQALMPAAAFAPDEVTIRLVGGTDVKWSPTIDYLRYVVLPNLAMLGYSSDIAVERRGHYPRGGGRVSMRIRNVRSLKPITLIERGEIGRIRGISHCVRLPAHVAERQASVAKSALLHYGYKDVEVAVETYPAGRDQHIGAGSGIALYAETSNKSVVGADALGERGKPAEKVGSEAAEKLHTEITSGCPFDRHMADIIIPYLAVANGRSHVRVSQLTTHTLTNIKITELVSGVKFDVSGELGKPAEFLVDGRSPQN
jgi:RNA 3'-terminal phosphate cyclase (ATP)